MTDLSKIKERLQSWLADPSQLTEEDFNVSTGTVHRALEFVNFLEKTEAALPPALGVSPGYDGEITFEFGVDNFAVSFKLYSSGQIVQSIYVSNKTMSQMFINE